MVVDFIDGDTWVGLYGDDQLLYEGHSLEARDLLKILNHQKVEVRTVAFADLDWLDARGNFPELFGDVVLQ